MKEIHVSKIADGDMAVISNWSNGNHYVGTLVQRYGKDLVAIGKSRKFSWPGAFEKNSSIDEQHNPDCKVIITSLNINF